MVLITRRCMRLKNGMTHWDCCGAAIVLATRIGKRLMGSFVRCEVLDLMSSFLFQYVLFSFFCGRSRAHTEK